MAKADRTGGEQTLREAGEARNDRDASHHHGGVSGHRMRTRVRSARDEICDGGRDGPAHGHNPVEGKARAVGAEVGAVHSSATPRSPLAMRTEGGNDAGAKGPHLIDGNSEAKDEAMAPATGIRTPTKVQQLQRTLYGKAKGERKWRAWSLYAELCRRDVLETALEAVVRNGGAAGVDGIGVAEIKAARESFLDALQNQLREKSYRPEPVRRVWIPKADGKRRPLGIPTVKDRIVQMALLLLLQPIFEADFHEHSYGYRPGRSAHQALEAIRLALWHGYHEVIDADLSGYFDTIEHAGLLRLVARRVSDGSILRLVKLFLKAPIVEEQNGTRTIQPSERGTPQGGVISPLLANLYLNGLDHQVNDRPATGARMIRYADDFVLLCRPGRAAALRQRLEGYLQRKGLSLNTAKTRVLDIRHDTFQFLGFEMSWRRSMHTHRHYPHVRPSRKSERHLRESVRRELNHWTHYRSCTEAIRQVNRVVRGWSQYFHYGHCTGVFVRADDWLRERVRTWLWGKYRRRLSRYEFFTNERIQGQYGLYRMPVHAPYTREPCRERSRKAGCGKTARPV